MFSGMACRDDVSFGGEGSIKGMKEPKSVPMKGKIGEGIGAGIGGVLMSGQTDLSQSIIES